MPPFNVEPGESVLCAKLHSGSNIERGGGDASSMFGPSGCGFGVDSWHGNHDNRFYKENSIYNSLTFSVIVVIVDFI